MLEIILPFLKEKCVKLVAVSKTQPDEAILDVCNRGHKVFGENRVQELLAKYERLPKDIEWHLIGHLQTNKVKYIAPFVSCIHSIDSLKLLMEVDKQALMNQRVIDCLLQFHIAEEETKYGLDINEATEILSSSQFRQTQGVRICGVMGMATFTENMTQVRKEFQHLFSIFTELKRQFFNDKAYFKEISMGMSGDYREAIEEGSTMVRIGTLIFGER